MFEQAELLDALGYDDFWVTEHHFSHYGGTIPHPPTFLAAVARSTRQIHLGVAMSVLPLHNPLQVAEDYAMLDVISGGGWSLASGRGSTPGVRGLPHQPRGDSPARMREAMQIIRRAWSGETVNFQGQLFAYEDVRVLPTGATARTRPSGWAPRAPTTRSAGPGDGFHLMTLPYMYEHAVLQHSIGVYREALARPATIPPAARSWASTSTSPTASARLAPRRASTSITTDSSRRRGTPTLRTDARAARRTWRTRWPAGTSSPATQRAASRSSNNGESCSASPRSRGRSTLAACPTMSPALNNIRLFAEKVIPAFERHGPGAMHDPVEYPEHFVRGYGFFGRRPQNDRSSHRATLTAGVSLTLTGK